MKIYEVRSYANRVRATAAASTETITYSSEGRRIVADLVIPQDPLGFVVFAHGNRPSGRKHPLAWRLTAALGRRFVTLAFDFRGYGDSDKIGPYEPGMTLDFSSEIIDAVAYLSRRFDVAEDRVALVGHSFGSVSVLRAGGALASRQIVAIGLADAERLTQSPGFVENQRQKLNQVGLAPPPEDVPSMYEPLFLRNLLSECHPGHIYLIAGEYDSEVSTLEGRIEDLTGECDRPVRRFTVPFANHMFWSDEPPPLKVRALSIVVDEEEWPDVLAGVIVELLRSDRDAPALSKTVEY